MVASFDCPWCAHYAEYRSTRTGFFLVFAHFFWGHPWKTARATLPVFKDQLPEFGDENG